MRYLTVSITHVLFCVLQPNQTVPQHWQCAMWSSSPAFVPSSSSPFSSSSSVSSVGDAEPTVCWMLCRWSVVCFVLVDGVSCCCWCYCCWGVVGFVNVLVDGVFCLWNLKPFFGHWISNQHGMEGEGGSISMWGPMQLNINAELLWFSECVFKKRSFLRVFYYNFLHSCTESDR